MLKALVDFLKLKPRQNSEQVASIVCPPTTEQATPTQTTSSGTQTKQEAATPSAPTQKKSQSSKSRQSQKKPTSPKTKKK